MPCAYARIVGDGRVYQGPALVKAIVFVPVSGADYADIYDGLDTESGEKVFRVKAAALTTWQITLDCGVLFSRGIYVDGKDGDVETTVLFEPLDPWA
jgi:hypothetical protein